MSIGSGESEAVVGKTVDFLREYVVIHFSTEEQLMQQHNYASYSAHKTQHTYFIQQISKIEADYKTSGGRLYLILQIQEELVKWLINHINGTDQKLGRFLKESSFKSPS